MSEAPTVADVAAVEGVDDFRIRARAFIEANIPKSNDRRMMGELSDEEELAEVARDRELQRLRAL